MHVRRLRLAHHRWRPRHLLGRQVATPEHVPAWRLRGQGRGHATGRGFGGVGG